MIYKERIQQFIDDLKKEEIVRKNLYGSSWLSGSSTDVYPITIWRDEIVLQWQSDRNIYNKFIQRMVDKNSDILKSGYFSKSDGSCPSRIVFRLKENLK